MLKEEGETGAKLDNLKKPKNANKYTVVNTQGSGMLDDVRIMRVSMSTLKMFLTVGGF